MSIALGYATSLAARNVILGMKTVEEVRRERLQMLRTEFGTWSALNEKIGLIARDSTLSQYLNQSKGTKTSKPKVMGSVMARRLEEACGKEIGWMDTDPALTGETGGQIAMQEFQALRDKLRAEVLAELQASAPSTGLSDEDRRRVAEVQAAMRPHRAPARKRGA